MNWKWKVDGLYPRNPEAFKPDGGAIWTTGEKGNIFEDQYFYVPKDFSWLGEQFKNVKSLVSGIGLKITNIEGEKFTKDMKSVSYKSKRSGDVKENTKIGNGVLTRKVDLERVVYYQPDKNVPTWEFGERVCAIKGKMNKQDVFLFVGFIEVAPEGKGEKGSGTHYSIPDDGRGVFIKEQMCGLLGDWGSYSLVEFNTKSRTPLIEGKTMIGLGPAGQKGNNIGSLRSSGANRPLVGALMGLAINVAQSKNEKHEEGKICGTTWGKEYEKRNKLGEWRANEEQAKREVWGKVWDEIMRARKECIDGSKLKLNKKDKNEIGTSLKSSSGWKKGEEYKKPQLIFDATRKITDAKKLRLMGESKWVPWTSSTELPYRYE
ncbi:hypothetical protein OVS_00640 [Mycoplasma ovis str. Michigan]|uniref:DUF31 domain-containing protein n=1 Tax=Mycoplasma ovis str. Michigan TaxID=1415773 RepID=A0ABM5P0Y8_9MOLU|nr:hypothetical protein [Mycoplasma ovis]AHC40118.1 hypothetical protein OVS_00640 [Mycoplasma ovis str. Michigan]